MSFWANVDINANNFEMGGGNLEPLPDGTRVLVVCEAAMSKTYDFVDYINIQWRVAQPEEYKNHVIFQKVKINDPAQSAKHRAMLAAIAKNAGGRLFAAMDAAKEAEPSDASLATLIGATMVLLLGLYEIKDSGTGEVTKTGNWVKAVSPRKDGTPAAAVAPRPAPPVDDYIPF